MALDAEDPATLLGFALYLPYGRPEACAPSAAVSAEQRQGIGRAMLERMLSRYPHAEVACVAGKAGYFEAQGFMPLAARARRC